jgi:hypothetical protein
LREAQTAERVSADKRVSGAGYRDDKEEEEEKGAR